VHPGRADGGARPGPEGANEIQKWIIARSIFGRDITG